MSIGTPYTTEFSTPSPDPRVSDPYFYGWRFVERPDRPSLPERHWAPARGLFFYGIPKFEVSKRNLVSHAT